MHSDVALYLISYGTVLSLTHPFSSPFCYVSSFFFFNDTATTEIYTLSYTTLFRSCICPSSTVPFVAGLDGVPATKDFARSEEHTSELQSRPHLVCRPLLEKKK